MCKVDGRVKNRGVKGSGDMEGGEEDTCRGCFVEEGIIINGEVRRMLELSRVKR
jgi:hypothetical protein